MTDLDESLFGPTPEPGEFPTRASRRGGRRAPTKRRGRRFLILVVVLALVGFGGYFAYQNVKPYYDAWREPKDFEGEGTGSVTIVVKPGDTGTQIAETLVRSGVVKTQAAFTQALNDHPGDAIQPGTYTLRQKMSGAAALSAMRNGARDLVKVTIREGLWKSEVYAALSKASGVPLADYQAAEKEAVANPSVLGLPAESKGNPEGWLYPATYTFDKGTNAKAQLQRLVGTAQSKLTELGVTADKAQQVLTLASLVEAEAHRAEDRPKVARVVINRVAKGMPLQLDSTSAYGAQVRPNKVQNAEAVRTAKNDYNTYVIPGMPAGPIGNPGEVSIKAALAPTPGPWLFFVTINPDTGETAFTTTNAEHDAQVAKLNAWCTANPGKC